MKESVLKLVVLAMFGFGCVDTTSTFPQEPSRVTDPCGGELEAKTLVIDQVSFVGHEGDVSDGLNIDGRLSDRSDEETCGQEDFVSPTGEPGVDNQFARLVPALDAVAGADSVLAVIQRTINSGGLLLSLEISKLDSLESDSCVEVQVGRATGQPSIGANGLLEESQTYERDPNIAPTLIEGARIEDGRLVAGPFDLELPLVVDNFEVFVQIRNATIAGSFTESGRFEGIIAGAIVIPEFAESISKIDASADVLRLISTSLFRLADLAPNAEGECEELSITLDVTAAPGFFFPDDDA